MRVLITAGATREPIDSVRYISNFSTGKTGAWIADHFTQNGIETHLLCGLGSERPRLKMTLIEYTSFANLDQTLRKTLGATRFDAVIHAAAVSDFSVLHPYPGKISSAQNPLSIQLTKNFKIVERLKNYSTHPSSTQIIAFKLTDTTEPTERSRAVEKLSRHPEIDWVVHNDLREIVEQSGQHPFRIFSKTHIVAEGQTKGHLAESLLTLIRNSHKEQNPL